ncbi:DUF2200 family protein [Lacticaseibacillus jixianensis]|uniref:DUF2200 family protein n=1 Tax=Lacticaseibacillus jixianensis TaxID=2486012 RepID=A0ABW4BDN4_9LACO|nr:DUF2200 family protein [Lacticaseibacillus jixianensis]
MAKAIGEMKIAQIYQLYLQKVTRKGRSQAELDAVLGWLTNLPAAALHTLAPAETVQAFCGRVQWPQAAAQITGVVCGVRVEAVADPLMRRVRQMDKVVDELAKGKAVAKIIRQPVAP